MASSSQPIIICPIFSISTSPSVGCPFHLLVLYCSYISSQKYIRNCKIKLKNNKQDIEKEAVINKEVYYELILLISLFYRLTCDYQLLGPLIHKVEIKRP